MIRVGAGMPTARFCTLIGVPERTYRRWQAKAKRDRPPKGPWPQPARDAARELATGHALDHPAWGHRKVWAMIRHDGHRVSQATVLRRCQMVCVRDVVLPEGSPDCDCDQDECGA